MEYRKTKRNPHSSDWIVLSFSKKIKGRNYVGAQVALERLKRRLTAAVPGAWHRVIQGHAEVVAGGGIK